MQGMSHISVTALTAFILFLFSSLAALASDNNIEKIARLYAPVFLTEAKRYNIPIPINFDNDWSAENNVANYNLFLQLNPKFVRKPYSKDSKLHPTVYYELIETKNHYFLTYYLFFPFDAGDYHTFEPGHPTGGHNNDATSLMLLVDKKEKTYRLITQHHGKIERFAFQALRRYRRRPVVEITSGNHAIRALKRGELLKEERVKQRRNVFYYHHGEKGEKYKLLRIYDTIWPKRNYKILFGRFDGGMGMQFKGNHGPWAPWARTFVEKGLFEKAHWPEKTFFDPSDVFCGELLHNCSKGYLQNPYKQ